MAMGDGKCTDLQKYRAVSFRGTIPNAHSGFGSAWAVPDSGHSHCHCHRFMLLCFLRSLQFFKRKRHSSALTSDKN